MIVEPAARGTAAAILAGALQAARADPRALCLACPTDHLIPDAAAFRAAVRAAAPTARAGRIVTFGIRPDRAETGYGWLEPAGPAGETGTIPLRRFVEKPDRAAAEAMLAGGRHLWNAGLFLFAADALVAAFAAHAPDTLARVRAALAEARGEGGFVHLGAAPWEGLAEISVDHAVMEKARGLHVMPFGGAWSDLGDWDAIWRAAPRDGDGVALSGAATAIDCAGALLRSEAGGPEIVGLGLRDVVAVAMADAVLVADRSRVQEVRAAVETLRLKGARQATDPARDHRPWGWFERLAGGEGFQVKRLVVRPGAALSLQSHRHRAEHWVVASGRARVTVGARVRALGAGGAVRVPLGAVHRLENPGPGELVLIEVQTGSYLGEDDIVRHEDRYHRGPGARG